MIVGNLICEQMQKNEAYVYHQTVRHLNIKVVNKYVWSLTFGPIRDKVTGY
jgi:hypothetical protein